MTARPPGTEPYLNTAAAVEHQQLLSNIPSSSEGHGTALTPKEGLYCRTKRVLGLKGDPSTTPHPQLQQKTSTGEILDRVASTLRHAPYRHQTTISSITSVSNLSIADPRQQRLRPSHSTCEHSSSSSIRRFMMGKSPAPTPEPEAMYIGSDSNQYMAVEMTEPNNPNFLPSEARRISTPPLPSDTPNKQGMRGFFFDPKAPAAETAQAIKPEGNSRELHERPAHVAEKVWYRVKLEVIDAEVASRAQFVTSAPDHLPNSPLCPRHPKHKSGGTGVCIYHGKNTTFYQDSDTPTPKEDSSNAFGDDIWRIPST
ncbi:hypothetical protein MMC28_001312 [Mycoblastus sanguinarius]|nr:hypothetical protein [Mycoblastus sanguinarius]